MNVTTAMAVALLLGQTGADGAAPSEAPAAQPTLPADATGPVITLDEALQVAGERNLELQALEAQLDQAQEITWKALSAYFPQVSVGASYTFQEELRQNVVFGVGPSTPLGGGVQAFDTVGQTSVVTQKNGLFGAQVNATQTLVSARLFFAIRGNRASQRGVVLDLENGRRQVLFGVARAYYGVAALKEGMGVSERLLEIARRQERDAQVRYNAGAIAKVGLIRAQIDRARAEEDVRRARAQFLSAKVALAGLLARDTAFDVEAPPEPTLPATELDPLVTQAIENRPDVKAARLRVRSAEEFRASTWSRYLPDVQAFGRYGWANIEGPNGENTSWAAGLQAQWTILDGFARESDIREARARVAEAKARAEAAAITVRTQVTQALLELESLRSNAQKAKEQRDLAAENLRLVDVAYRAGTATAVEQADAVAQLRNAEILLNTERLNAQLAALNVLNVIGSFNPRTH
ncbi:MAG TPA: TolC family protein [Anaeromyxobacter sp.]|nr:TolC family protein [Anaeromyxobacter sp.]